MQSDILNKELETEIWTCLEQVTDPELDESIIDMGFVERVKVTQDKKLVEVEFRLPTYWCSPNFAFLMAFDIRLSIAALPWVQAVNVQLNDHCFADKVIEGVNGDRDFSDVFAKYCDGDDLNAVREKFLEKAFIRRQETLLLGLRQCGVSETDIVGMKLETLDATSFQGEEEAKQKPRYRSLLLERGLAAQPTDLAFRTWEGDPLTVAGLREYLGRLRSVRINMEFNGALCRGLQSTRYKEVQLSEDGPSLIDFIQNKVPLRPAEASS